MHPESVFVHSSSTDRAGVMHDYTDTFDQPQYGELEHPVIVVIV